jgi:CheY-like chemotaxis protein
MTESRQILVVDDTPANLHVLMELLEPAGYTMLAARSGERALRIAARANPNLILLDVMMPEMDGYEVCRRLKADAQTASIPVVFVTADARDDVAAAVREAGGVGVLSKPYAQADLLEMVRANLR